MTDYKTDYYNAHELHFAKKYPCAYSDGHYSRPSIPPIKTANGLTKYIINFITWYGFRATRLNVSGRLIDGTEKTASGQILSKKKWIKSSTRRGTADISATINGRSIMMEIKEGRDKPSEHQLKEQSLERSAGGIYEFISNPEEFLNLFYSLVTS